MTRSVRKLSIVALALLAAGVLTACGNANKVITEGDNTGAGGVNAAYLRLGNLRYQVTLSRALNPSQDPEYLVGLPPRSAPLASSQLYFAVFMLVQNTTKQAGVAASRFLLTDTQGNVYRPLPLGAANPYAYRPQLVAPGNQLPPFGTVAAGGTTASELLLFRLPVSVYDNRPLVLHIIDPDGKTATVILDV